jgi:hypothetical protein
MTISSNVADVRSIALPAATPYTITTSASVAIRYRDSFAVTLATGLGRILPACVVKSE